MLSSEMARRLMRYAVVGVAVMAVFTGLNWLIGLRFGKNVSFILAYPPAVGLHFWLNKHWTFGCKRGDAGRQVSEYLAMVLVTFLIQAAVFGAITQLTRLPGWVAAGIANGSQMIITFLAMQFRIFKPDAAGRSDASKVVP
jgi:putative flippase GtrA